VKIAVKPDAGGGRNSQAFRVHALRGDENWPACIFGIPYNHQADSAQGQ